MPRGFLTENVAYEIDASLDRKVLPAAFEVTLNDVPVERVMRRGRFVFPFVMDFYAGDLRVSVTNAGHVLASVDLEVDPDIAKLSRDEYASMVADIARWTLALYRLGQVTLPARVSVGGSRLDLVTLDLVRTNLAAFERAVSRIADQPIRVLRSARAWRNVLQARRIDDQAINAALRSGRWRKASALEAMAAPRLVGALGGRWTPEIAEDCREDRLDVYENRALLGFIRWLDGTLARIASRISAGGGEVHPASAMTWTERLLRWRTRLATLSKRGLFAGLAPVPTLHATSVFRLHPDYASAFSAMARMRSGFGMGTFTAPSVPIDRTYVLYEIWCYIGILLAAAEAFPVCRQAIGELLRGCNAPNALGTVLAQGDSARIPLTEELTLTYQRRFKPTASSDGTRTIMIEAVPDITVARIDSTGKCIGAVVMDPKYRTGASLTDGIRDLHVYRDAILADDGRRLVVAAVAVAPRPIGFREVSDSLPSDAPVAFAGRPGHDPTTFRRLLGLATQALS